MEVKLQAFLDEVIDSLIKLEIVLFFHSNPGTIDTARAIAMRIYRNEEATAAALEQLSAKHVLDRTTLGAGKYELYSLSQDESIRSVIGLLDKRFHSDKDTMLQIIRRFLPTGKNPPVPSGGATGNN